MKIEIEIKLKILKIYEYVYNFMRSFKRQF
jgi:hypothetical protein